MNPYKFFGAQLLVVLAWLLTFGATAFVISHGDDMMTVIQGWAMDEPIWLEV